MIREIVFVIMLFGVLSSVNAQLNDIPPPPPPPPAPSESRETIVEEPEFEVQDVEFVDFEVAEEVAAPGRNNFKSGYLLKPIKDGYDFYYLPSGNVSRDKIKYGILKYGKVLLPNIFNLDYYYSYDERNGTVVLALEKKKGLYSVNLEKWVIPPMYSEIRKLKDGLYKARKDSGLGLLDEDGEVVIPFENYEINTISGYNNYVLINKGYAKAYGVYNLDTKSLSIPNQYKSLRQTRGNYFLAQRNDGLFNLLDFNNNPQFDTWYTSMVQPSTERPYLIVSQNGTYGVIDFNGKEIVPFKYRMIKNYAYKDGSYLAQDSKGKYGCMLIDGTVTVPFKYDNFTAGNYSKLAVTQIDDRCGILQLNDGVPREIVTCDFESVDIKNECIVVQKDDKFGLLNRFGDEVLATKYESVEVVDGNLVIVSRKGKYQLYDVLGKPITKETYKKMKGLYEKSGYSKKLTYFKCTKPNNKVVLIDKTGKLVIDREFGDILMYKSNRAIVSNKGKIGIYDTSKNKMIVNCEYDQMVEKSKKSYYGFKGNQVYWINISKNVTAKLIE